MAGNKTCACDKKRAAPQPAALPARQSAPRRARTGNQARLRAAHQCSECEERTKKGPEHADKTGGGGGGPAKPAKPASLDVWGLQVTRAMCGCKAGIASDIAWSNTAASTYASCNTPANNDSDKVEACFAAAHPTATVVATTDQSGTMTLPPASADPCQRISDKSTLVHEVMHSRHADSMARAQGGAFFAAWQALKGDKDRLDKLEPSFPAQVAAYRAQWVSGDDWAKDEVNSYTWERRFLESALQALNQIC